MSETNSLEAAAFYCDNCVFAQEDIFGKQEGCLTGRLFQYPANSLELVPAPTDSSRLVYKVKGRLGCPSFRTEDWLCKNIVDKMDVLSFTSDELDKEIDAQALALVREENRLKADVIIQLANPDHVDYAINLAGRINSGAIKPARYIFVAADPQVDLGRIHKHFLANPIGSEVLCSLALDKDVDLFDLGVENVVSPWVWGIDWDIDPFDDLLEVVDYNLNEKLSRFVALDFSGEDQGLFFRTDIYRALGGNYEINFIEKIRALTQHQNSPDLLRSNYWDFSEAYDTRGDDVSID